MNMEERPSQVIEEYLLVLYKLQRDGETAKSVTLANSLDIARRPFTRLWAGCSGMG